jgi:hypothetical protein
MRSAAAIHTTPIESPAFAKQSSLLLTGKQEEALLKLDLGDLVLPQVNDLQVDGLKSSWLSRLMGR